MSIGVDQIYLSMANPDTGEFLTAKVYTVDGVYEPDGVTPRRLSIGQLVMALCLQRAAELEGDIVKKMEELEDISEMLEAMTEIENDILENDVNMSTATIKYKGEDYTYYKFLTEVMEMDDVPTGTANAKSEEFISALESKMDEYNSFSQQTMIMLQSQTNKRDQTYDLISNALKSLNQVLTANVNNI